MGRKTPVLDPQIDRFRCRLAKVAKVATGVGNVSIPEIDRFRCRLAKVAKDASRILS
jgi:hypothetical protein